MQLVTLDFETCFDDEYSLRKLTTEEYVRDPRFKVHCLGYKNGDAEAYIFNPRQEPIPTHGAFLCHHAHFDGLILSHHYNIRPAFWFDTLCMSRLVLPHLKSHSLESLAQYFGLGTKTVPYNLFKGKRDLEPVIQRELEEGCKHDVDLTYQIFRELLPCVSQEELRVIDLTIRMFTEPALELDTQILNDYVDELARNKKAALVALGVNEEDLASANKFAEILTRLGVEPPTKISPKTGRQSLAFAKTDAGFKELMEHENETVQALVAARLGVKSTINETRARRLSDIASRGPAPVYLNYCGAHTTRFSGGDKVNWQNLPRGGTIRKAIHAPAGQLLGIGDLSQIECRMLNYAAGQGDVLQAFRDGRDLYCEGASRFYGEPVIKKRSELDDWRRQLFKQVELGCGYGMGHMKFRNYAAQQNIHVTDQESKQLIDFYRQTHPNVKQLWKEGDQVLALLLANGSGYAFNNMVYIRDQKVHHVTSGTFMDYSNLRYDTNANEYYLDTWKGRKKIYGALVVENVIQFLARIVLTQAMLRVAPVYKIALQVHDELVALIPEVLPDAAVKFIYDEMVRVPDWCAGIPLEAEVMYDKCYVK